MSISTPIIVFYAVVLVLIVLFASLYKLINQPSFRSDESDSTEAGYLEDGTGKPLRLTLEDEHEGSDMPHVETIGGTRMGSL